MGAIKKHPCVKLIIGFIFKEEAVLKKAEDILESQFGRIDFASQILAFKHTDYYKNEFGAGLKRKFIAFKKLILPQELSKLKIITNQIEKRLAHLRQRRINIDPGYLDMAKLVLASTKDYRHRIYLNKGIYAEITLFYQDKTFKSWEWTYPDYKSAEYITIFNKIRESYAKQIQKK